MTLTPDTDIESTIEAPGESPTRRTPIAVATDTPLGASIPDADLEVEPSLIEVSRTLIFGSAQTLRTPRGWLVSACAALLALGFAIEILGVRAAVERLHLATLPAEVFLWLPEPSGVAEPALASPMSGRPTTVAPKPAAGARVPKAPTRSDDTQETIRPRPAAPRRVEEEEREGGPLYIQDR